MNFTPLFFVGILIIIGMDFTSVVCGGLAIACTYMWCKKNPNLPPGPWNFPIIGYLPWLDSKAPHLSLTKLSQKFGPIYGLYLGSVYTVVISDVKIAKKILMKDVASGRAPLHLNHILMKGDGLIFSQGDLWKDQRKLVHHFLRALGASKVSRNKKKMEDNIKRNVLNLVQYVKSQGNRVILDPVELLLHHLGSIISLLVLGKSWDRDDKTWKLLLQLMNEGAKHFGVVGIINLLPFLSILPKYKKIIRFLSEGIEMTHTTYKEIIDEARPLSHETGTVSDLIEAFLAEKSKREGTVDAEKFYSDRQFCFLLSDVFGAGLETTLSSLSWYLLYMAVYTEVQNKVRQELAQVLSGKIPTLDDLAALPYVEASIAEVQRIQTVVPLGVPHGALSELEIERFKVPKGTMIVPLLWAIQMDPKVWDDPEVFRPERFLDGEGKFFKPESLIPFQLGKRMCLGEELARMILFLFGATILQNFQIDCEDGAEVDLTGVCGLTLSPKRHKLVFTSL